MKKTVLSNLKEKISIFKDENIDFGKTINILILIMIFSGIFGFIYETIFYRIDLGYFVKRGSSYGPWIPIYAFGGLLISLITYKYRKKPYLVFIINCLITGILEYSTGHLLYDFWGIRLWDYNNEIWNFGNINGYICLRSVLFFGISSLLLIYIIIPTIKKLSKKITSNKLNLISYGLGIIFFLDIIVYQILN